MIGRVAVALASDESLRESLRRTDCVGVGTDFNEAGVGYDGVPESKGVAIAVA